jgi:hypothetical protein
MSVVYTTRFAAIEGFSSSTPLVVYTVPSGYRAVLTNVAISVGINALPGAGLVIGPAPVLVAYAGADTSTAQPTSYLASGRWVFEAGETMAIATAGTPLWVADFSLAGWLLALP